MFNKFSYRLGKQGFLYAVETLHFGQTFKAFLQWQAHTFFTGGRVVAVGTSCATDVLECPVPLTLMSSIKICRLGMVNPNSRMYLWAKETKCLVTAAVEKKIAAVRTITNTSAKISFYDI